MRGIRYVKAVLLVCTMLFCSTGCATVRLGTIPPPQDTQQLRVALYAVTGLVRQGDWGQSAEKFREWNHQRMGRILRGFGAYQVISHEDVMAVTGDGELSEWQLSRNDWELAREMGRALYADYVMVSVRGTLGDPDYYFETTLLNIATGAKYAVRINNTRERKPNSPRLPPGTVGLAYKELFSDAKGDLLATALRKGRHRQLETDLQQQFIRKLEQIRAREQQAAAQAAAARLAAERAALERAAAERDMREKQEMERRAAELEARQEAERVRIAAEKLASEKAEAARIAVAKAAREKAEAERLAAIKLEHERRAAAEAEELRKVEARRYREEQERSRIAAEKSRTQSARQISYQEAEGKTDVKQQNRKKLIVYDISAPEAMQVAALILSEALREEIMNRGTYTLVNREDLAKLVEEMKFQQSGLIDPSQAVSFGKGAGAHEVVTGKIGTIGRSLLLQSKRVDVETMLNLSAASLKGEPGREDELLQGLPGLVDRLLNKK